MSTHDEDLRSYYMHRPAKQGRGVHPPWPLKPQRPMEVGYPKVFIRLKVSYDIILYYILAIV